MLSKDTFIKGLKILATMKNPIDREDKFIIDVWYEALKDIPNEAYQKACIYLLKTEVWHPAVSQIREAAGFACDVESGSDTLAEQQWELVKAAVSSFGRNRQPEFQDQITQNAVDSMGWQDFCDSNIQESGNWRARFISTYNNVKVNGRRTAEMKSIGSFKAIQCGNQKAVTA